MYILQTILYIQTNLSMSHVLLAEFTYFAPELRTSLDYGTYITFFTTS